MAKRMTWKEIQETYPDQWVGLTDVERNDFMQFPIANLMKTADELYDMQISGQGIITKYTTPETFPYGQVLIWGCGNE